MALLPPPAQATMESGRGDKDLETVLKVKATAGDEKL